MVRGSKSEKRLQIRTFEVLWKTKREIVEAEITRMKDEDGRTEPRFELRTSASKNIIKKMKEKDLKDLKAVGEQMARTGYSEEHKRRLVIFAPRPAPFLTLGNLFNRTTIDDLDWRKDITRDVY